jgi:hypothetical protein
MKANQIKQWTPMIFVIAMTLFGVMSCTTNPTSSDPVEPVTYEMQASQAGPGYASTDTPVLTKFTGYLRVSESGVCWLLVVSESEIYELKTEVEIRGIIYNQPARVIGYISDTVSPACTQYPVVLVKKLFIIYDPEHTD